MQAAATRISEQQVDDSTAVSAKKQRELSRMMAGIADGAAGYIELLAARAQCHRISTHERTDDNDDGSSVSTTGSDTGSSFHSSECQLSSDS